MARKGLREADVLGETRAAIISDGRRGERALLSGALALALCLFGWRAVSVLTTPADGASAATAEEARLASLLEPLAGPSRLKASIRTRADGSQGYLILIDRAPGNAASMAARIEDLIAVAADYDPASGDTLKVEQFPFAHGASARPSVSALVELGALAGLCGLIVAALAKGALRSASSAPGRPVAMPKADGIRPLEPEVIEIGGPALNRAGQTAATDPRAAAQILRRWMNMKDDAA